METIMELNDIEKSYIESLQELNSYILQLIENKKNNIDKVEYNNDVILLENQPDWHYYLLNIQYALSGYYPDEESIIHAYNYADDRIKCFRKCIYNLSIDTLEIILKNIDNHMHTWQCDLCKKK